MKCGEIDLSNDIHYLLKGIHWCMFCSGTPLDRDIDIFKEVFSLSGNIIMLFYEKIYYNNNDSSKVVFENPEDLLFRIYYCDEYPDLSLLDFGYEELSEVNKFILCHNEYEKHYNIKLYLEFYI